MNRMNSTPSSVIHIQRCARVRVEKVNAFEMELIVVAAMLGCL